MLNIQAEIIPIEPDPDNSGVGKRVNQKKPAVFILKLKISDLNSAFANSFSKN